MSLKDIRRRIEAGASAKAIGEQINATRRGEQSEPTRPTGVRAPARGKSDSSDRPLSDDPSDIALKRAAGMA